MAPLFLRLNVAVDMGPSAARPEDPVPALASADPRGHRYRSSMGRPSAGRDPRRSGRRGAGAASCPRAPAAPHGPAWRRPSTLHVLRPGPAVSISSGHRPPWARRAEPCRVGGAMGRSGSAATAHAAGAPAARTPGHRCAWSGGPADLASRAGSWMGSWRCRRWSWPSRWRRFSASRSEPDRGARPPDPAGRRPDDAGRWRWAPRRSLHVEAVRATGLFGDPRIVLNHALLVALPTFVVSVQRAAARRQSWRRPMLSFLGVGAPPEALSWGGLVIVGVAALEEGAVDRVGAWRRHWCHRARPEPARGRPPRPGAPDACATAWSSPVVARPVLMIAGKDPSRPSAAMARTSAPMGAPAVAAGFGTHVFSVMRRAETLDTESAFSTVALAGSGRSGPGSARARPRPHRAVEDFVRAVCLTDVLIHAFGQWGAAGVAAARRLWKTWRRRRPPW